MCDNKQEPVIALDEENAFDCVCSIGIDHYDIRSQMGRQERQDGDELISGKLVTKGMKEFDGVC